jgi:hypothetical protein
MENRSSISSPSPLNHGGDTSQLTLLMETTKLDSKDKKESFMEKERSCDARDIAAIDFLTRISLSGSTHTDIHQHPSIHPLRTHNHSTTPSHSLLLPNNTSQLENHPILETVNESHHPITNVEEDTISLDDSSG